MKSTHWLVLPVGAVIALASLAAQAQSPNMTGPNNTGAQKTGEAYPNDPNAANPNKPKAQVVQKVENSRPAQATKRGVKKAGNAVARTGNKAAGAVRNTGNRLAQKLPPAPAGGAAAPSNN